MQHLPRYPRRLQSRPHRRVWRGVEAPAVQDVCPHHCPTPPPREPASGAPGRTTALRSSLRPSVGPQWWQVPTGCSATSDTRLPRAHPSTTSPTRTCRPGNARRTFSGSPTIRHWSWAPGTCPSRRYGAQLVAAFRGHRDDGIAAGGLLLLHERARTVQHDGGDDGQREHRRAAPSRGSRHRPRRQNWPATHAQEGAGSGRPIPHRGRPSPGSWRARSHTG